MPNRAADDGHAEHDGVLSLSGAVELAELVFGAGQVDPEPFDFAEPALAFGFGDAGDDVVADSSVSSILKRRLLAVGEASRGQVFGFGRDSGPV